MKLSSDILEVMDYLHFEPTHKTDRRWTGLCPFHDDHTPSFSFVESERGDVFFICHSGACGANGRDLYGAVRWKEFSGLDDDLTRKRISARCAEIRGTVRRIDVPQYQYHSPSPPSTTSSVRPLPTIATREQRQVMTTAWTWWQSQLYGNGTRAGEARRYLTRRGANLDLCQQRGYLGYAPPMSPSSSLFKTFTTLLRDTCGSAWGPLAKSVGILTDKGTIRLHHRIIFATLNEEGQVTYFQGRQAQEMHTDTDKRWKYLCPPNLKKIAMSLSIGRPILLGTVAVEGPFEMLALAQQDIPHQATLGSGPLDWERITQPVLLAQDANQAGDIQAARHSREAHRRGMVAYRLRPPAPHNEVDIWLRDGGLLDFLDAIPIEVPIAI